MREKLYIYKEIDNKQTMDYENEDRLLDDLVFPRKKTLTDLWRDKWEKEFESSK